MNKHLFLGIHLILITLMAYLGVQGAYLIWNDDVSPAVENTLAAPAKDTDLPQHSARKDFVRKSQSIVGRNLFKVLTEEAQQAGQPTPKPVQTIKPPVDKSMQLTLKGTVTGDTGLYAVMEDKKQRQQNLYKPGESIDDAILKTVFKDHVILEKNGEVFRIDMEEPETGSGSGKRSNGRNTVSRRGRQTSSSPPPPPPAPDNNMMPGDDDTDEPDMPDMDDLRRQIKSRPHTSNGEQDGILVYGIRPTSVFRKIGLRNGDIVQQIDDADVQTTDDLLNAIQDSPEESSFTISIIRGGQPRQVVYDVSGNSEN